MGWYDSDMCPTKAQLHTINESVESLDDVRWCCGVKTVPSDMLQLFYKAGPRTQSQERVEPKSVF